MITSIINSLSSLPREAITFILAALPISEVRGSIPFGLFSGLGTARTLVISVIGNMSIIIPVLIFLKPVSGFLRRFWIFKKFFDWVFERTSKNAGLIEKYETLGLMLFVAVPLPMTGAWSGCIAASLFKIRFRYAFFAISLGVVTASLIVTLVCLLGKGVICRVLLLNY